MVLVNMEDIHRLCRLSNSELDDFLVNLVLDIEFESNRPPLFRDADPINKALDIVLAISAKGNLLRHQLADTSWSDEGWNSSTGTTLDVGRFVPPSGFIASDPRPYSKPLGGLWTSPLRSDGTTSWSRYSYAHSNQRFTNRTVKVPTDNYEKDNALHLNALADIEAVNGTSDAVKPLSAEWLRLVQSKYRSIRFSWACVLEAIVEEGSRYEAVSSLSVCSTFWLYFPSW